MYLLKNSMWRVLFVYLLIPRNFVSVDSAATCPAEPTEEESCTTISSWVNFKSVVNDATSGSRVVVCAPFLIRATEHLTLSKSIDIICKKVSEEDKCEIYGSSSHLYIRYNNVAIKGFAFRDSTDTAVKTYSNLRNIQICDSYFENNHKPSGTGGALRTSSNVALEIIRSTFVNNTALASGGGAVYLQYSNLTVINSTFLQNSAKNGGAIQISQSTGQAYVEGSTFEENTSTGSGPCISLKNATFEDGGRNSGSHNLRISSSECNGFYEQLPRICTEFPVPPVLLSPAVTSYDAFGILLGYPSCTTACTGGANTYWSFGSRDWVSAWANYNMTLDRSFELDPYDSRATMRSRGNISTTEGSDEIVFMGDGNVGSPRFYIDGDWENVEFTAYGKYVRDINPLPYSGLTLVARSGHATSYLNPCDAAGYYARIYANSGEVAFQKEYYHDSGVIGNVYSKSIRKNFFNGGIPYDTWIGMKFIIYTVPETSDVQLELWLDQTNGTNGGEWILVHQYLDKEGSWPANDVVPEICTNVTDAMPILGPRDSCFLRIDGSEVHWKDASIRRIDPSTNGVITPNNSIDFNYDIEFQEDEMAVSFSESTASSELIFGYIIAANKPVTVRIFQQDCIADAPSSLEVAPLILENGNPSSLYTNAMVKVDVKQDSIQNEGNGVWSFDSATNKGLLSFCIRLDLYVDGTDEEISGNFHETKVTVEVDMVAGFSITSIFTSRDNATETDSTVDLDYELDVYQCVGGIRVDPAPPLSQGDSLGMCIDINTDNVKLDEVQNLTLTQGDFGVANPVQDGKPNTLTSVDCTLNGNQRCFIRTMMISSFFTAEAQNTAVTAEGAVTLKFGRRRLERSESKEIDDQAGQW
eukprot:CAMPEP_0195281954 /NCGR_PEP_ID=MMETSP0707-20130614/1047_1 /TAXON_ID=33640 /ORGANISM="Asterionellopsis glacialis, Strain CCMP134" /LENGTH=868 /DNA_ID=CAMNT_0040340893 /DNA_START=141 /DNA_END=2744 /DNA_ORIENTATION=-